MGKKSAEIHFDLARSMIAASKKMWNGTRIWIAYWWNIFIDGCWLPRDLSRRD
ncbi:hypothetical protein [Sphingomonas abietis]|uniref:Integrase n=1 Tax=Sphingomonas abietis TaxID=3012344 RepID=A0ABY7NGJ2_9SPHN|nr:hypothetical protein [Sphingomonas abietis]WBO20679.1 hypothetical protein PBT88_10655 [Sphingomonas abietis]